MESKIFSADALAGKVALITGGGTGLGRATAEELVLAGATVVVAGRREEPLKEVVEAIGERASQVTGDIRDQADAEKIIEFVKAQHGRLDLLVNNAGGQYFVPAEGIELKGWQAVMRLNVDATLRMSELAAELMIKQQSGGKIVNITLSPHNGLTGMTHSSAARAMVEGLTAELAARWRDHGIAVVAVAAGHFETEVLSKYPEQMTRSLEVAVPLQRLGRPQEHGWLVTLLATPMTDALNGSVITLDGARDNWYGPWPPQMIVDPDGTVPTEKRRS